MDVIMCIINLMIVPFLGVIISYRRAGKEIRASAELLSDWVVFLVTTLIICHLGLMILSKVFGIVIGTQSALYSMEASVVACCLPYIIQVIKKYIELKVNLRFEVTERNKDKDTEA